MEIKDIHSALEHIAKRFTGLEALTNLVAFAKDPEEKAIAKAHHCFGRGIRNELGLWGKNALTEYFKRLGISHADDMSGILLTSFHRTLNRREIGLDGQIEIYKKFWKDEEEKARMTTKTKDF